MFPAPPITSGLCWFYGPQPSGLLAWSNIFALYCYLSLCSILRALPSFPDWMSNLLGSQLTIIGIVFPLVVGLISVLFQKKSARIHIQSAYQLHSGYMFAGLSGLSLAAFVVLGGMTLSIGDGYLNTSFAVTAFVWMLFNIILSIWFFVSSLNVLDESKRDRLMNKFFYLR